MMPLILALSWKQCHLTIFVPLEGTIPRSMAIFHSDESLPSSLLSPEFSLIGDYVDSTLTQITQDIGGPVVGDLVTFARQLQETDLAVCNSEDFEDLNGGEAIGHGTTMTV